MPLINAYQSKNLNKPSNYNKWRNIAARSNNLPSSRLALGWNLTAIMWANKSRNRSDNQAKYNLGFGQLSDNGAPFKMGLGQLRASIGIRMREENGMYSKTNF